MTAEATIDTGTLLERYLQVRRASEELCKPLAIEDYVVQSMPDASPAKWHLAHTTWFFETLVLKPALPDYREVNPQFAYLFNSYYNTLGPQFYRPHRGLVTRPTVAEVFAYRAHVDREMERLLTGAEQKGWEIPEEVIVTGMHHEQQHQELLLTDIKHLFSRNPLYPAYAGDYSLPARRARRSPGPMRWVKLQGGLREIGFSGDGFAYDNETPRHKVYLRDFAIASRLVTSGEYLHFIQDGGYRRPELWLSDGWGAVQAEGWKAPLYWEEKDGQWFQFTLSGLRPVDPAEPVCHVSFYEADAFARWASARLPTEAEWEVAAAGVPIEGNFVEDGFFHPIPLRDPGEGISQLFGDVWEWTASSYSPYPGYKPPEGALGEYNAKFMSNQYVLRGGSCATPRSHIRVTYRNFFPPQARWQFSGIRLARDL
ncbi:Hercynine oxygenase [bacterium HR33]|nr:Hercynine oxygenase [bacterium HR33]